MGNFYQDNEDLKFYIERAIDWDALVRVVEYDFRSADGFKTTEEALGTYTDILDMVGTFVSDEIAPRAASIDRKGLTLKKGEVVAPPELDAIFEQIKELELHKLCAPRELGGLNCPILLYMIIAEVMARGDVSIMTHHSFHGGIASALLIYSIMEGSSTFDIEGGKLLSTRFEKEIREIINGDAWGSMDITEPCAGSDMAALTTRATQDENGDWRLTGQKIFITSGNGKYHLVVARTEENKTEDAFSGLRGLSLFLVPSAEKDTDGTMQTQVVVERLEEKLGHHASPTCTVSFENSRGYLIGKRGEGFRNMLLLMNNARLAVGCESLGVCEAAYRLARDYAAERRSMGKTIDQHELIASYLDAMQTDIQGIRALAMHAGFHEEMCQRHRVKAVVLEQSDPEGAREAQEIAAENANIARRLTPLLKFFAAERAVEMARECIQIHGGYGYTKEFGAEKLLRDALVAPIYEGTTQIQALMVMKDSLQSVIRSPKSFVKEIAESRWQSLSASDPLDRRVAKLKNLALRAQQHLVTRTATQKLKSLRGVPITEWPETFTQRWDPKRDFSYALLHAERLTRILTDVAILEIIQGQCQRFPERRDLLERTLERAEPRCRFLYEELTTTGDRLLQKLADQDPENVSNLAATTSTTEENTSRASA